MPDKLDVRLIPGTRSVDALIGEGYFPVITCLGGNELLLAYRAGAAHMGLGGRLDVRPSVDGA